MASAENNVSNPATATSSLNGDAASSAARGDRQQLLQLQQSAQTSDGAGLWQQLTGNAFFTAGAGLAALGFAARLGQQGVRRGADLLKRRLLVDVEINVNDPTYNWFLLWMTAQQDARTRAHAISSSSSSGVMDRLMRRFTPGMHHMSIRTEETQLPNGARQTSFALVPGPGRHILRYNNAFVLVSRVRESKSMDYNKGRPWETVTLTTLYSQRFIFSDIFREAHALAQQSTEGRTPIYVPDSISWRPFGQPRRKRPLSSVILGEGVSERIVADVREFLTSSKWYYDRGVPYRRGYLLYGPPGSGKTSFIQALAGEIDYGIAQLNLSQRGLTDDRLNVLLQQVPARTILLLEDADAAFANRRAVQTPAADGYQGANVTFSGLLNALDGVASAEERILFLTTNHVDRLDEALVRPGRVDMAVHLGDVSRWQVEQFWDRFYGELDPQGEWKASFLQRLEESGIVETANGDSSAVRHRTSAAALQGLFLYNKGNLQGALDTVEGLLPEGAVAGPGGDRRVVG